MRSATLPNPLEGAEIARIIGLLGNRPADRDRRSRSSSDNSIPCMSGKLAQAPSGHVCPMSQSICLPRSTPRSARYARANTVATAAYVGPTVATLPFRPRGRSQAPRITRPPSPMRSDGGVATAAAARDNPATMLLSGPAGGVIAASALGEAISARDIITFDMGGTSADFSLIEAGRVRLSTERVIDEQVLRVDMLDIETISSGGGSIATVDRAGGARSGRSRPARVPARSATASAAPTPP